MKTNYITSGAETSVAWSKIVTTLEATPNAFGGSSCGFHMEVG